MKLPPVAGIGGSVRDFVNRTKQTVGEGLVEDADHGPALVRKSPGQPDGRSCCWFGVGHAPIQGSLVLQARMRFSIRRRYAPAGSLRVRRELDGGERWHAQIG